MFERQYLSIFISLINLKKCHKIFSISRKCSTLSLLKSLPNFKPSLKKFLIPKRKLILSILNKIINKLRMSSKKYWTPSLNSPNNSAYKIKKMKMQEAKRSNKTKKYKTKENKEHNPRLSTRLIFIRFTKNVILILHYAS